MSDWVKVICDGNEIDVLAQSWMTGESIASEAAECEYEGSGGYLNDPSSWPRTYTVNGIDYYVEMEYTPSFHSRRVRTER